MALPNNRLWAPANPDGRLYDRNEAIELAAENGWSVLIEYRPAEIEDIDISWFTDAAWEAIDDWMREDDNLSCDDGWPNIMPSSFRKDEERPPAWGRLWTAIRDLLQDHLDLSEAAWQPTGRSMRREYSGVWRMMNGGDDG